MVENHRQSDIVDEAFDALRESQPPEGPNSQALEQTLQAVRQAQRKSPRISLIERIRNMNKLIKYPIAAAIALAFFAGGAYMLLGRSAAIAFADVREQIEQAKTMTLTANVEMTGLPMPMKMNMKVKMYFKSPGLMRQEITAEAKPAPGTTRPATAPAIQTMINIFDIANKKGITLVPSQKMAIVHEFKNVPPEAFAKTQERNILDRLKKAVAGEHEDLGEKMIDGRKLKGYRCKDPSMGAKTTMDIWVDAASGKPVLVEEKLPDDMGKVTMTDFAINPKLDDALFDTRVPEGYEIKKQSVDFEFREEDVIKSLGLLAKYCGGVFPKTLMPTRELIKRFDKMPEFAKMSKEEGMEFGMQITKAMTSRITITKAMTSRIMILNAGGEFVYAGEGVKLGDKATPILWYKAKDAKAYRVIYGDLHVEDAEEAPQPPASPTTSNSEEDLIKYLRLMAERLDGVFPNGTNLTPTPEQREEHSKKKEASVEEKNEIVRLMSKAMSFQMRMMQDGEFVYAGEGVKLGDKATPILWYKAKDAKAYRVIYGDLHVEDAEEALQAPASKPATETR